MIEVLLALSAGIIAGCCTGLIPGLHMNLIIGFLLAHLAWFAPLPTSALLVFVVSLSVSQSVMSSIPSVLLGAPEEETFLAVLPGHELTKEGKGYEAILLLTLGAAAGLLSALILALPFALLLPLAYKTVQQVIPFVLIFVSLFLVFRERRILAAFIVLVLSGMLGWLAFTLPVQQPLTPLLTGLFGVASLLTSLHTLPKIQKQNTLPLRQLGIYNKSFAGSWFIASIVAPLCSFLPGIGAGHAAVISSELQEHTSRRFLFLIGALNMLVLSLSFVTAFAIQKTRTGSSAAALALLGRITPENVIAIMSIEVLTFVLVFPLLILSAKHASLLLNKINYRALTLTVLLALLLLNLVLSNWLGILVLLTASALGVFCITSKVRRINLMGCLLIPSILYYLL